jgi:predicted DNA-binding transcriptional regulator YafY
MNRIDRLTAILIQLQSQKIVTAEDIADRFEISTRTVYRDVKALMEAGVPIGSEAGTGYFIVDGYHLPPVMFTQDEAGAMLVAGKLVEKMTDKSVRQAYTSALLKIKSVLHTAEKDHLENLDAGVEVFLRSRSDGPASSEFPDHFMTAIQRAVASRTVLKITYTNQQEESTRREVEPLGVSYYGMAWHLIGWCRYRKEYRDFRSDRIRDLVNTGQSFREREHISLQEYFRTRTQAHRGLTKVVARFSKEGLRGRPLYGSTHQVDKGDHIRAEFMMDNIDFMSRWLLMYGRHVEIEAPEELKQKVADLIEELRDHHGVRRFENLKI